MVALAKEDHTTFKIAFMVRLQALFRCRSCRVSSNDGDVNVRLLATSRGNLSSISCAKLLTSEERDASQCIQQGGFPSDFITDVADRDELRQKLKSSDVPFSELIDFSQSIAAHQFWSTCLHGVRIFRLV